MIGPEKLTPLLPREPSTSEVGKELAASAGVLPALQRLARLLGRQAVRELAQHQPCNDGSTSATNGVCKENRHAT